MPSTFTDPTTEVLLRAKPADQPPPVDHLEVLKRFLDKMLVALIPFQEPKNRMLQIAKEIEIEFGIVL